MLTFKILPINNYESQYPAYGMPTSLRTTGLLKSLPSHSIATTAYFTHFAPLRFETKQLFSSTSHVSKTLGAKSKSARHISGRNRACSSSLAGPLLPQRASTQVVLASWFLTIRSSELA